MRAIGLGISRFWSKKLTYAVVGVVGLIVGMTLVGVAANAAPGNTSSSVTSESSTGESVSKKTHTSATESSKKKPVVAEADENQRVPLRTTTTTSTSTTSSTNAASAPSLAGQTVNAPESITKIAQGVEPSPSPTTETAAKCSNEAPGAPPGAYTIQPGELFGTLASSRGLGQSVLAAWNPQIPNPAYVVACRDWLVFSAPAEPPPATKVEAAAKPAAASESINPTSSKLVSKEAAADSKAQWCPRSKSVGPDGAYVVKEGDNYWRIARRIHPGVADDNYWMVQEVQKMVTSNQDWITNANQLCPGDRLII